MRFGNNVNRQERLLIVATNLHSVYSDGPLTKSESLAAYVRRLLESERRDERGSLPTVSQMLDQA
jgi:hypothetical protein